MTGRLNEAVTQTVSFSDNLGSCYNRSITTTLNVLTAVPDGEQLQGQLVRMQLAQAAWRHKAGRAYTALLKSQGGAQAGVIVLPEGATMDCAEAPGGGKHCDPTPIFPPDSY